jgi:ribosome modulation factor
MIDFGSFRDSNSYIDGSKAWYDGKSDEDNPYEKGSEEYNLWLAGWSDADYWNKYLRGKDETGKH